MIARNRVKQLSLNGIIYFGRNMFKAYLLMENITSHTKYSMTVHEYKFNAWCKNM